MNNLGNFSSISASLGSLYAQPRQSEREEQKASTDSELSLKEKAAELATVNQRLLEELARHQEIRLLGQSEQQHRFLFAETPQPQWIFDLRSHRLLAVNNAALALLGYTREEFVALPASRLLFPEAIPYFHRDVNIPCPKAQSRGHWSLCKKDGTPIQVEIKAIDLKYDGCPARLIVPIPVPEPRSPQPEQPQARRMDTINDTASSRCMENTSPTPDTQARPLVPQFSQPPPISAPQETSPTITLAPAPACLPLPPTNPTTKLAEAAVRNPAKTEPPKPVAPAPTLTEVPRTPARKEFPRAQAVPVASKPAPARRAPSAKQTILLVEPDGRARGLARFLLSRQGYRVIETDCSSTVLALWESESVNVDVLLTDVALPEGMSGTHLADQLRQSKPELKVVYTSAPDPESEPVSVDQGIIPKPYTADKLLQAVQSCLV